MHSNHGLQNPSSQLAGTATNPHQSSPIMALLSKVPEVTLYFWIIKVLATTVGETAADYLNTNLKIGLTGTTAIMTILLAVALFYQFKAKQYTPWIYWLSITLISVVGTLITDNLVDNFNVPLWVTTVAFSVALALTFFAWHRSERTLSIHSIFTPKREMYYWLTVLFTFALGTAAGDLVAEKMDLGYLGSAFAFAGVIAVIALAWQFKKLDAILGFWLVYILTRPLGASIGDFLSQAQDVGGLGLGTTVTSLIFLLGILGVVTFLTLSKRDRISMRP